MHARIALALFSSALGCGAAEPPRSASPSAEVSERSGELEVYVEQTQGATPLR